MSSELARTTAFFRLLTQKHSCPLMILLCWNIHQKMKCVFKNLFGHRYMIMLIKLKHLSLLYFWEQQLDYLDVKQVPFLQEVDPLESELLLIHGSFLKFTIVNRENTEKEEANIRKKERTTNFVKCFAQFLLPKCNSFLQTKR